MDTLPELEKEDLNESIQQQAVPTAILSGPYSYLLGEDKKGIDGSSFDRRKPNYPDVELSPEGEAEAEGTSVALRHLTDAWVRHSFSNKIT